MANVTTTARIYPSAGDPTAANVHNLSMPTANTEYSQAISNETKRLVIRTRIYGELRMAYVATETATKYITIPAACSRNIERVNLNSFIIYFRSNVPNQIVEIEEWT